MLKEECRTANQTNYDILYHSKFCKFLQEHALRVAMESVSIDRCFVYVIEKSVLIIYFTSHIYKVVFQLCLRDLLLVLLLPKIC